MAFKFKSRCLVLILMWCMCYAKITENKTESSAEVKPEKIKKSTDGAALMFADEFKQTLERYLFGICPQNFKMQLGNKAKNTTTPTCDLDDEQQDLAGRLATLALRAHTASRSDCSRLGAALANTLGELARTAATRQVNAVAAANEANKKRKLSKSQKLKIQAKQRTALAVKKKAAAMAAAAAAKMAS
ncbi:uncharacterized protein LOC115451448 isoform X4 [Manduca sexta]|uniref:uncharacterized protein LOC115451448 isoform X4 n=1 Tax=Manduca sexta TaxID=7130 RepID=UPI0018907361|nr:uncharacterized protein LOC115451448 isoform X4 [Manduca sexta]